MSDFGGTDYATEWSDASVIKLEGPAQTVATGINDAGEVAGYSYDIGPYFATATEWSGGSVTYLQNLPGATESVAYGINDAGQVVGASWIGGVVYASEWSGGSVINLGGLPGQTYNLANSINDSGQVVGVTAGINSYAVEWSGGSIIDLGGLPGSILSEATGINDAGQVVGWTVVDGVGFEAIEWSGASIINLGALPGYTVSEAMGINDAGQAVGWSEFAPRPPAIPEPSTWAMMLVGFGGLAFAGSRRATTNRATLARRASRKSGPAFDGLSLID